MEQMASRIGIEPGSGLVGRFGDTVVLIRRGGPAAGGADQSAGELLELAAAVASDRQLPATVIAARLASWVIGHMSEDGKTYLICGLMPIEEFYDRYQQASGLTIDPVKLHFYEVLNRYQQVTTVLGTAYRVVRLGKSHQNIVVARLQTAAYLLAEELRSALEEVL